MTSEAAPTDADRAFLVDPAAAESKAAEEQKAKVLAEVDGEKKRAMEKELDDIEGLKTVQSEATRKKVLGEIAPYVRELREQNAQLKEMVLELRRDRAKTGPVAAKATVDDLEKIYPDMFEAGWLRRPAKTA